MSSIELDLAPRVHRQRVEITNLNRQLRALNKQYPGERKKSFANRDPMYEAQRSGLLKERVELQSAHSQMRKQLRQVGG